MTTSPPSGLSAEAKEFIPLIPSSTTHIPLYVDENTVASIYHPSDHQPLMLQSIYPMLLSNSKGADHLPIPEIEFHIDSCSNLSQPISITNGNSSSAATPSTNNTSQIILLPATNSASGFYPVPPPPPMLYSPNDPPLHGYYPIEYCEPSLINFSLHQPNFTSKSSRISSQQTRGNTFRPYRSSTRGSSRGGGGNINRNAYYDYPSRRNGASGRGTSFVNKRLSSSAYHSPEYNNYYQSSPSRSRGYASRAPATHDEYRKEQFDYYQSEKDFYEGDYPPTGPMNDDGTPFEFRPEDFPSLPNNPTPQSDKTGTLSTAPKPASSWNAIVSSTAPRPHSTSPQPLPASQDSRSDRSRSFNTKLAHPVDRKASTTKKSLHPPSPSLRASKLEDPAPKADLPDDGFIQTKQQHRRLKRRNKMREEQAGAGLNETFDSLTLAAATSEQTDTGNGTRASSSGSNSSDTSDYDDAVDNFDAE